MAGAGRGKAGCDGAAAAADAAVLRGWQKSCPSVALLAALAGVTSLCSLRLELSGSRDGAPEGLARALGTWPRLRKLVLDARALDMMAAWAQAQALCSGGSVHGGNQRAVR